MTTDPKLDALAEANDIFDLHPIRIRRSPYPRVRGGFPILDNPVAGSVYVTAHKSTSIIAIFNRGREHKWWDPFMWTDSYGHRYYIPFGCGSISMFHEGPAHPGDRVLRIHIQYKLLKKGPEAITEVVRGVLDRDQYLELRDICHAPDDATTWGPWMTAIER